MAGIELKLKSIMAQAFAAVLEENGHKEVVDPQVHTSQHSDFQADAAMGLAKRLKQNPRDIASKVMEKISSDPLFENAEVAGPGFINLTLSKDALAEGVIALVEDPRLGVPETARQTIVVDYSAPNVAKEMHVGHLRSTIIGDAVVRLMEWLGHDVLRRNHVGDWGTPFGMLIEHLLDVGETEGAESLSLGDLNGFYGAARKKFESSEAFQDRARARVVALQGGDAQTLRLWTLLIERSQSYFVSVYDQLDVRLDGSEFWGESAYDEMLEPTLKELDEKGLTTKSDGADCLFPEGFRNREDQPLPLIVRKSDGGFGYAATDLAAIRNRTVDLNSDRILYVVGAPQRQHLEMIFVAAKMAGWLKPPATAEHISFGSVLGTDGKMFKSRAGTTIKLADLLSEAISRAAATIVEKNPELDEAQRTRVSREVGIGAIKYADLSSERTRDYVFDFDRMLAFEGNTAPYLQYAHARIQSILRQAGSESKDKTTNSIHITHDAERQLGLVLLRFADIVAEVSDSLMFHRLAGYLFEVATSFSGFYTNCPVLAAENESTRNSRLILCEVTARTLATGLGLLGIQAPNRM